MRDMKILMRIICIEVETFTGMILNDFAEGSRKEGKEYWTNDRALRNAKQKLLCIR